MTRLASLFLVVSLLSFGARAQTAPTPQPTAPVTAPKVVTAAAPPFSQGIIIPTLRLGFDSKGTATLGKYAAGPGYFVSWNFLPSADKTVRWLSLGFVGFGTLTTPASGPGQAFALSVGGCLGTYNGMIKVCETYDLINAGGAGITGLVAHPTLQNLATVIAFSLNLDIGGVNLSQVLSSGKLGAAAPHVQVREPPGFL